MVAEPGQGLVNKSHQGQKWDMSLQCSTCGYKGKKSTDGACPACGSFDFKRKSRLKLEPEKNKESLGIKSIAMMLLWGYWVYLIIQKLSGEEDEE